MIQVRDCHEGELLYEFVDNNKLLLTLEDNILRHRFRRIIAKDESFSLHLRLWRKIL